MKPPKVVELTRQDLTPDGDVFCPHPKAKMQLWNTHPRIFLVLEDDAAQCPYCSRIYKLKTDQPQKNVIEKMHPPLGKDDV